MLDYKALGRRIAHYRKMSFFTQSALAEKLGVSDSYMSQIECGRVEISLKRLNQVAETLNIDIVQLLSDTNTSQRNYGSSEILELTEKWTPEQKRFLLSLLQSVNEQMYTTEKKKWS